MRRVILESPYAGRSAWRLVAFFQRMANRRYARACLRDSLTRGEAPIASHLLYTQRGVLRDDVPDDRTKGIKAGLAWGVVAEATVMYVDRGVSLGMQFAAQHAHEARRPVEFRELKPGRLARTRRYADHLAGGLGGDLLSTGVPIYPGEFVRPLTEGMVRKGGRNQGPSQVTVRPPPPGPSTVSKGGTPRSVGEVFGRSCDCCQERKACTCMRDGAPTLPAKPPTVTC